MGKVSITGDLLFETVIPLAKFESRSKKTGKVTEQLCTVNNQSRWKRYSEAKIKAEYKQILRDFYIPEPEGIALDSMIVEFSILRHNKKKLDVDGLIYNHKWFLDLLQDMNWLVDDDQVHLVLVPFIVDKTLTETQFRVKAYS